MTNDYIRRQDAIDAFGLSEKTRKYDGDHSGYDTRMLYEIQDAIESLEPADVVQVVRCRDCKYNANPPEVGNADCDLFYGMTEQYGFCHRAERRTDG